MRVWTPPAVAFGVIVALAAAGLGGCAGRSVQITVDRPDALASAVIDVRVSGLSPGQQVTIGAQTQDGNRLRWSAAATYRADAQGRLDLARDAATGGSYQGVHPLGLLVTLRPDGAPRPAAPPTRIEITLTVLSGRRTLAHTVINRVFQPAGMTVRPLSVATDGVLGTYYMPAGGGRRPAVLTVGGSEGGMRAAQALARALAAAGHPALGVAYFGAPGLPATLAGVPLEYLGRALAFLATQPGVDARRIAVMGPSRGGELAQLLGAYYPRLVHGVIATVPDDVSLCDYPGCTRAAWTWHGRPLPFTVQFDQPAPADNPAAVLPYGRIAAPLFLACAGHDSIWNSCRYARAALAHHAAVHLGTGDILLAYPHAGHGIGIPAPGAVSLDPRLDGDSATANEEASEQIWPRLLAYLDHLPA
jgi:dienelactone hydrolase